MNDSIVLFDSSEFVSYSGSKADNFYARMRLDIVEIISELDEKWSAVKHVDPQVEYRQSFKLKPFEEFIAEEMKRRVPESQPSIDAKNSSKPRPKITAPQRSPRVKSVRKSVPMDTVSESVPLNRSSTVNKEKQAITPILKPIRKQLAWIRVEDIHIPSN